MSGDVPWYVSAFGADYLAVYPHRDVDSARREVANLLARAPFSGPMLDLCCGFGRHTLALRERGVDVFGVDLSADLLARARDLPGGEHLRGRLVRADARAVPFADGAFGSVVNLFSSFGYFGDAGDARVLAEIARLLRPGGHALLDLMNPARIRKGLVPRSESRRGKALLREVRSLEEEGRRVVKEVTLEVPGEEPRRWREDVRLYEHEEIVAAAARLGLSCEAAWGGFEGAPFEPDAERQVLLLARSQG